jgi:hypothetical protein
MDVPSQLGPAPPGRRARPAPVPGPERLRQLALAVRSGAYRVRPEQVAEAMLSAPPRWLDGRRAHRSD